jgi:hypothetical protein
VPTVSGTIRSVSTPSDLASRTRYPRVYAKPDGNTTCNICRRTKDPLTEDHVPPSNCLLERQVQIEPFENFLRRDEPVLPISQNGVRFRTLCSDCNNRRLGSDYDPHLGSMVRALQSRFSPVYSPTDRWKTWCRSGLVIRALFGHLLAATTDDADTVPDTEMRAFVLDQSTARPPSLRVFYWLHPHLDIKLLRSVAMPASRRGSTDFGIFQILKFFPIGFAVTDLDAYEGLPRLDLFLRGRADVEVDLPFSLQLARDADWPERVEGRNFVVGGRSFSDALTARPRPKPKKK